MKAIKKESEVKSAEDDGVKGKTGPRGSSAPCAPDLSEVRLNHV